MKDSGEQPGQGPERMNDVGSKFQLVSCAVSSVVKIEGLPLYKYLKLHTSGSAKHRKFADTINQTGH